MFLNVTSKTVLSTEFSLPLVSKRTQATRYKLNFTLNQSLRLKLKEIMSDSWAAWSTQFSVSPSHKFRENSNFIFRCERPCGSGNELQMSFTSLLFTRFWGNFVYNCVLIYGLSICKKVTTSAITIKSKYSKSLIIVTCLLSITVLSLPNQFEVSKVEFNEYIIMTKLGIVGVIGLPCR